MLSPRWPVLRLSGTDGQWTIPNAAGHIRMLEVAGFDVVRRVRPFVEPFGTGHPAASAPLRKRARSALESLYLGGRGVGVSAVLARPAI